MKNHLVNGSPSMCQRFKITCSQWDEGFWTTVGWAWWYLWNHHSLQVHTCPQPCWTRRPEPPACRSPDHGGRSLPQTPSLPWLGSRIVRRCKILVWSLLTCSGKQCSFQNLQTYIKASLGEFVNSDHICKGAPFPKYFKQWSRMFRELR